MVKSRARVATKKKVVSAVVRTTKKRGPVTRGPALDAAARDYANLIANPCTARLTNTIWPGTAGSIVSRFESDFITFDGAGITAGTLSFIPGVLGVYATSALTDTTAVNFIDLSTQTPGYGFLTTVASSVRCVAACLQVSFPGTELTRSGIVSLGVHPFSTVAPNLTGAAGGGGITTTVGQIRTLTQHTERTPQNMAEVTWMPGPGDSDWFEFVGTSNTDKVDAACPKNALTMTVAGLPAATGVRIRFVSVVEWTPRNAQGLVSAIEVPKSSNTINDVLRALPANLGTSWFINAYKRAQPYIKAANSVINYGSKLLGPAMAIM